MHGAGPRATVARIGQRAWAEIEEVSHMLQIGQPAPDSDVEAYVRGEREARRLSLSGYAGKWVVLFFYPRDFTSKHGVA